MARAGRRGGTWPWVLALLLIAVGLTIDTREAAADRRSSTRSRIGRRPPDIVLVITDDQRWDSTWAMPKVDSKLVAKGVRFTNAFVVDPLCCPSRASILTGLYSHGTGVYRNGGRLGGVKALDDSSTVATWLDGAGYHTALVGKYFNHYSGNYIPPGWDHWVAFIGDNGDYYRYSLAVDGTVEHHGSDPRAYSTNVLAGRADHFVRSVPEGEPLFLYFAPYSPHGPAVPASRDEGSFGDLMPRRSPSYNEAVVSDKPRFIRTTERIGSGGRASLDEEIRNEYEALQSVDDAVSRLIESLKELGRLSNTLFVFTSDNGIGRGEHRWTNKHVPYEESIRVPLVVRYDPLVQHAAVENDLVLNIDLAPTIASLTGLEISGRDGESLVPLLAGSDVGWRKNFLIEGIRWGQTGETPMPTYCAVRSRGALYAAYSDGFEELYDFSHDPFELRNYPRSHPRLLASMRSRLAELCDPAPPGY